MKDKEDKNRLDSINGMDGENGINGKRMMKRRGKERKVRGNGI